MNKQAHVKLLMAKAEESLGAGRELLAGGHHGFSAARIYFAMFYAAQAALLNKGLQFSKHSAVIAAFGKELVKTGAVPEEAFGALRNGFDARAEGDYGLEPVSADEVQKLADSAQSFLDIVRAHLTKEGYDLS